MCKIAMLSIRSNVAAAHRSVSGDYVQSPQLADCLCAFATSPSVSIRTKQWKDELSAHRHFGLVCLRSSTVCRNGEIPATSAELGLLRSRTTGQPFPMAFVGPVQGRLRQLWNQPPSAKFMPAEVSSRPQKSPKSGVYASLMFEACSPFWPTVTSNSTF